MAIFFKGLTHGFGPKMTIFPSVFLQAMQARKMSFMVFQNEKPPFQAILGYKTKEVEKVEKLTFFQRGNPCLFSKNGHFSYFFFLGIIGQENVFYDILERENAFRGHKNKKLKRRKIAIFSEGVNPCFSSKKDHFSNFFCLGNIGQENVLDDILEGKHAFLGYKNNKFKKSKN